MKRVLFGLLSVLLFCSMLAGSVQGQVSVGKVEKFAGTTMGSVEWNVSVVRLPDSPSVDIQAGVQQVLDQLNSEMSTWISGSEVSRFNDSASTDWFGVSAETATVVQRSQEISAATNGAFDITVKPLVELWNFGAGRSDFVLPADDEVQRILSQTGYENVEWRLDPPAIRKTNPAIQIDLSGIAKGYAVDLVRHWILDHGVKAWFIEVGGEISVGGSKPDGLDWRVGIEKPLDDQRTVEHVVSIGEKCMATSGDYRNFAIVGGRRYSHTISPETGQPVEHALASVSVVADDCMTADALATAITVAGPGKVQEIARHFGVEVLAMERMDNGLFHEISTPEFAKYLQGPSIVAEAAPRSSMGVMLATVVLVGLAILGLALGAIFANKPIQGSCGGLGNVAGTGDCQICRGSENACPERPPAETRNVPGNV